MNIDIEEHHRELMGDPPKRDVLLIARRNGFAFVAGAAELSSMKRISPTSTPSMSARSTGVTVSALR